jgi:excisionase family DNA binding protein
MTTACTAASVSAHGYLSTGAVARVLGKSDDTVRRLIDKNRIEAQRDVGGHWRIHKTALAKYRTGSVIRRKPAK